MLRWDLVGGIQVAVPRNPLATAFDGTLLWVLSDGSLTQINPSDGAVLHSDAVGIHGKSLACDGTHVWVLDAPGTRLLRVYPGLRGPGGLVYDTYTLPAAMDAMAFDGTNLYGVQASGAIARISRVNGSVSDPRWAPAGNGPFGMAFDGVNLWISSAADRKVTRIAIASGQADQFSIGGGTSGPGQRAPVVFDGANTWVWLPHRSGFQKVELHSTHEPPVIPLDFGGGTSVQAGMAFDGKSLWVAGPGRIYEIDPSTGNEVRTLTVVGTHTTVTFDGVNLWTNGLNENSVLRF